MHNIKRGDIYNDGKSDYKINSLETHKSKFLFWERREYFVTCHSTFGCRHVFSLKKFLKYFKLGELSQAKGILEPYFPIASERLEKIRNDWAKNFTGRKSRDSCECLRGGIVPSLDPGEKVIVPKHNRTSWEVKSKVIK